MDDVSEKRAVLGSAAEALMHHLSYVTVAILCQQDGVPIEIGSGTVVQIANRYFVLTAKHVVDAYADADIGLGTRQEELREFVPIISKGLHPTADVAWLEISPQVLENAGKSSIQLCRVEPGVCHMQDDLVLMFGYPAVLLEKSRWEQRELGIRPLAYHTFTVPPEKWPTEPTPDPATELIVEYPDNNNYMGDHEVEALEIAGMSGGGIWATNMNTRGVYSPTSARLVGILSSLLTVRRVVRATQVGAVLQQIALDFPDLAGEIAMK